MTAFQERRRGAIGSAAVQAVLLLILSATVSCSPSSNDGTNGTDTGFRRTAIDVSGSSAEGGMEVPAEKTATPVQLNHSFLYHPAFTPGPVHIVSNTSAVITDSESGTVYLCDLSGSAYETIVRFGVGAGELQSVVAIVGHPSGFVVYGYVGNAQTKCLEFDSQGSLISETLMGQAFRDIAFAGLSLAGVRVIPDGINPIDPSQQSVENSYLITIYDGIADTEEPIGRVLPLLEQKIEIPWTAWAFASSGFVHADSDALYATHEALNYLLIVDPTDWTSTLVSIDNSQFREVDFGNQDQPRSHLIHTDISAAQRDDGTTVYLAEAASVLASNGEYGWVRRIDPHTFETDLIFLPEQTAGFISAYGTLLLVSDPYFTQTVVLYDLETLPRVGR